MSYGCIRKQVPEASFVMMSFFVRSPQLFVEWRGFMVHLACIFHPRGVKEEHVALLIQLFFISNAFE